MSLPPADGPLTPHAGGVILAVRLQPGARATRIEGVRRLEDGRAVLNVRVTEAPEKGKANAALVRLLAKSWDLPGSSISLISGHRDRRKRLLIEGETKALMVDLARYLARGKAAAPESRGAP